MHLPSWVGTLSGLGLSACLGSPPALPPVPETETSGLEGSVSGSVESSTGLDDSTGSTSGVDVTGTTGFDAEWLEGFAWRKPIRIHPEADLDEFPVGLVLDGDAELIANAMPDGSDLFVTAADGISVLPFELESYSDESTAIWIQARSRGRWTPWCTSTTGTPHHRHLQSHRRPGQIVSQRSGT